MSSNTAASITAGLSAAPSGAHYLTSKRVCVLVTSLAAAGQELCRISGALHGERLSSSGQTAGIMWAGFNQPTRTTHSEQNTRGTFLWFSVPPDTSQVGAVSVW